MVLTNRMRLFLVGCMSARVIISIIAKYVGYNMNWAMPLLGAIALLPATGFIVQFVFGLRETGRGAAGGKIWWTNMRPIHGVMYLLFAMFAFRKKPFAWRVLLVDALIGLLAWVHHYII